MRKYNFPNMRMTIEAPNIKIAYRIAKEFEKNVYQEGKNWEEEAKKIAKKYAIKITRKIKCQLNL